VSKLPTRHEKHTLIRQEKRSENSFLLTDEKKNKLKILKYYTCQQRHISALLVVNEKNKEDMP
jgi:hypothetical protein